MDRSVLNESRKWGRVFHPVLAEFGVEWRLMEHVRGDVGEGGGGMDTLVRQARPFVPSMFIAHEPQIPSLQDRLKLRE